MRGFSCQKEVHGSLYNPCYGNNIMYAMLSRMEVAARQKPSALVPYVASSVFGIYVVSLLFPATKKKRMAHNRSKHKKFIQSL